MKQKALADKYPGQTIDNLTLNGILKDMSSGLTEDTIINKYKLKKLQYLEVKTHFKNLSGPGSNKPVKDSRLPMSAFRAKTGARRQGKHETCLCGSGRKHGSCCANK